MSLLSKIDERREQAKQLQTKNRNQIIYNAGKSEAQTINDIEGDPDVGYAILVAFALSLVYATLTVIARAQYGQEAESLSVLGGSLKTFCIFILVAYVFHPLNSFLLRVLEFIVSTVCGCYIVYLFNEEGYYDSMSRVSSLGTLCTWFFIELEWYYGLTTICIVGAYTYANNYSLA